MTTKRSTEKMVGRARVRTSDKRGPLGPVVYLRTAWVDDETCMVTMYDAQRRIVQQRAATADEAKRVRFQKGGC